MSGSLLSALIICEAEPELPGHCHTQQRCDSRHRGFCPVGLGLEVLTALLSQLNGRLQCRAVVAPGEEAGRLSEARGFVGHWRRLGVDWLGGPELADIHVRH